MCKTHCSQYICEYHCRLWTSFIWKYTGMRKCIVYRSLECIGYALSKKNSFFFKVFALCYQSAYIEDMAVLWL